MLVRELKKLEDFGKEIIINWLVEEDDEDMVDTGLDFQDVVDINFNIQFVETELEY